MRLGKSKKKEEKVDAKEEVVEEKKEYSIREMQTEINNAIYNLIVKYYNSDTKGSWIKEALTTFQVQQQFRQSVMKAGSKVSAERLAAQEEANKKWREEMEELKAKRRAEDKAKRDEKKRLQAEETLFKIRQAKEILGLKNL